MENSFDNIKHIVDGILGDPRRDWGSGGWYEYDCPSCSDEKGSRDGKYNLAVKIDGDGMWCHCWRCGYAASLSRMVRDYGTESDRETLKEELEAVRSLKLYSIGADGDPAADIEPDELRLPNGFVPISDKSDATALGYLEGRGVDLRLVSRYRIGYVPLYSGKCGGRIIIPSYDIYGRINYWTARDYTGNAKVKIYNPDVDKKSVVFNEGLVNWYEPITLVEGPFDHVAVPNSIPLLGKVISEDCAVFKALKERSRSNINIMLDDDAWDSAVRMYRFLDSVFGERVRMVRCPEGYDPSDAHRDWGRRGIVNLLRSASRLDEWTLANNGR